MRISPVSNGFNVFGGMTLRMLIFLEGEIVIFLGQESGDVSVVRKSIKK